MLPRYESIPFAEHPKNIILMIGDGMALPQISAHSYWSDRYSTVFESFPYLGFHKSYSHDDLITDSAAAATAFACGSKTTNTAIGVLPPDNHHCQTILEALEALGWATGVVVTCSAPHATPAAFVAHRDIRAFTEEIAEDYLAANLDCFVGGGEQYFDQRADEANLLDSFRGKGYIVRSGLNWSKLPLDGSAPFMVFTDPREPGTAAAGRDYLPEAVGRCCNFLKQRSDKGFFLLVEGSQIDWAGHANDRVWLEAEMRDFDWAIQRALHFAAADRETLVVVTGDHECGGLSLAPSGKSIKSTFGTRFHTGVMVPIFAYGPGANRFMGVYENTGVYDRLRSALNMQKRNP